MNYYKGLLEIGKTGSYDGVPDELIRDYKNDFALELERRESKISDTITWIPLKEDNYLKFSELEKNDNLIVKFHDGTECDHKDDWPIAVLTHFRKHK